MEIHQSNLQGKEIFRWNVNKKYSLFLKGIVIVGLIAGVGSISLATLVLISSLNSMMISMVIFVVFIITLFVFNVFKKTRNDCFIIIHENGIHIRYIIDEQRRYSEGGFFHYNSILEITSGNWILPCQLHLIDGNVISFHLPYMENTFSIDKLIQMWKNSMEHGADTEISQQF